MHAHFERHVYHRHSHETYSFGVTEAGAQSFTCRGASRTSVAGMLMVFNPDDPHDGHAATEQGFTYRMLHVGPDLVADVLAAAAGRPVGPPLFAEPVVRDAGAARAVRRLHRALLDGAPPLRRDELLDTVVAGLARRAGGRPVEPRAAGSAPEMARTARIAREVLHDRDQGEITAAELAAAAGRSRFAVYRSFHAVYGMAPSDYQRQLRLRAARGLLAAGRSPAQAAAEAGFADQSHLTRWFTRCYGVTPGAYRRAAGVGTSH
ncbi:transcriptional regulator [Sphaerisporangium rufum]|uniref:Transcriptional regulator n=2 Tax=Sphaerisporangium rufum TaxID=1381558 RepID=A0A919R565_9ACTN|nr:transcriptional regulator [Sphaerisporangium rufum]